MDNISLNLQGIGIGLLTFIIIGIFHPLVIKGEYYFGKKVNYAFLLAGLVCLGFAFAVESLIACTILAIVAFSCFWSILEVNHQVRRVEKGWFPMNPKRQNEYKREIFEWEKNSAKKGGSRVSQRANLINQHINN